MATAFSRRDMPSNCAGSTGGGAFSSFVVDAARRHRDAHAPDARAPDAPCAACLRHARHHRAIADVRRAGVSAGRPSREDPHQTRRRANPTRSSCRRPGATIEHPPTRLSLATRRDPRASGYDPSAPPRCVAHKFKNRRSPSRRRIGWRPPVSETRRASDKAHYFNRRALPRRRRTRCASRRILRMMYFIEQRYAYVASTGVSSDGRAIRHESAPRAKPTRAHLAHLLFLLSSGTLRSPRDVGRLPLRRPCGLEGLRTVAEDERMLQAHRCG